MNKSTLNYSDGLVSLRKKWGPPKRFFAFAAMMLMSVFAIAQTVTGTVTDQGTGEPIIGASIIESGVAANGTITDIDGRFALELKSENPTLTVTYVGFETTEIAYNGQNDLAIQLVSGALLDEVVVTGLGVSKKQKALGYATTSLSAAELKLTPVTNVASALYGKAPGVTIRTVPGGATSGVNINIRGFSSISGSTQPLIVMDGVPIRNGDFANTSYWSNQRIQGNGLTDINPDDIESMTILKGASAAALYGSDAVNGVIVITSKKGKKGQGLGVSFNASYNVDQIAYLPRYQNERGPGYFTNFSAGPGQGEDGFLAVDTDGDGIDDTRSLIGTTVNFGPKFDGQPVMSWTGDVRPYEAAENSYGDLFQDAQSSNINLAISQGNENGSVRFSFTRQDNTMISLNSSNVRNVANLGSTFNVGDKLTTQINIKYINQTTNNRPYKVDRMINNFGGMMDRFESADWYKENYETSLGYRYRTGTQPSLTPDENIIYPGSRDAILDYMWRVNNILQEEKSDRIIANLTQTWNITNGLSLRGRVGTDYTNERIEGRTSTANPSVLYANPGGGFSMSNSNNSLVYTDVLLTYTQDITQDLTFQAMGGYTAQKDEFFATNRRTDGGLSTENFFDMAASRLVPRAGSSRSAEVKDAWIGTVNFDYKSWLFLEGTIRRDRTSRLSPDNNAFIYPSVNASLILNEAFNLPSAIKFAKLRASYGIVGNYPGRYQANIAYNQSSLGVQQAGGLPVLFTNISNSFGNDLIRPEQKHEFEMGLNVDFFTRFNADISYYNARIVDQILPVDIPASSGATRILSNIGTLRNQGIEIALRADILRNSDFTWRMIANYARNVNVVEKLANGSTELLHANFDGNAAQIRSVVGRPMGDIFAHPVATNDAGEQIVAPNGLHQLDGDTWETYGNALPDFEGGLINNFGYKGITLDIITDVSFGGAIMPTGVYWLTSRGATEESLNFSDAERGGLRYYVDENGKGVQTNDDRGPNNEQVFNDGMLLPGVLFDGEPNTNVISQARYYNGTYNWGGPQYGNSRYELYINDNNWVKVREIALGYQLPQNVSRKIGMQRASLSVYGRNLFFLYRTIKDIDPEQTTAGSRWYQNINNAGNNPSFRSFGIQLSSNF